jgi:hypothetical protein
MATACKKDDALQKKGASKLIQSNISGVNGPTNGLVDQELTFSLLWANAGGTAKLDHLQDSSVNNIKVIKLFAITNAIDTAVVKTQPSNIYTYVFKAPSAGTYYLKFYKTDNSDKTAIIDTLVIK